MSSPPLPPKRNFKNRIGGASAQHPPLSAALPTGTASAAGAGLNVARRLSLDRQQDMHDPQEQQDWEDNEDNKHRRDREEDEMLSHSPHSHSHSRKSNNNNNNNNRSNNNNNNAINNNNSYYRQSNNNRYNNDSNNGREAHAEDPATLSARSRPHSSSSASASASVSVSAPPQEKPLPQARNAPPSLPPRTAHRLDGAADLDERLAQSRLSAQQLAQRNPFALDEIDEEIYDFPLLHLAPDILIGAGVEVRGDFQYEGLLRLDGKFQGRFVTSRADLVVGPQGVFIGELSPSVQRVWVDGGRIVGRVCVEQLFLTGRAQIKGDIRCRVLQIFGGEVEIRGGMTVRADLDLAEAMPTPSPQPAQKKDSHTREEAREREKKDIDVRKDLGKESAKDVEASIESARAEKLAAKQRRREAKQMSKEDELPSTSPAKENKEHEKEQIPKSDVAADDKSQKYADNAVSSDSKTDDDHQNNKKNDGKTNNKSIPSEVSGHAQSEHHREKAKEEKDRVTSPPKTSSAAAEKQALSARDRETKESPPVTKNGSPPLRNKEGSKESPDKANDTDGASSPKEKTDDETNANSGWKIITDKDPLPPSPRTGEHKKQAHEQDEKNEATHVADELHANDESSAEKGDEVSANVHASEDKEKSINEAQRAGDDQEDDINLEDSLDRLRQKKE